MKTSSFCRFCVLSLSINQAITSLAPEHGPPPYTASSGGWIDCSYSVYESGNSVVLKHLSLFKDFFSYLSETRQTMHERYLTKRDRKIINLRK